jgi:hypothetical protein
MANWIGIFVPVSEAALFLRARLSFELVISSCLAPARPRLLRLPEYARTWLPSSLLCLRLIARRVVLGSASMQ